MSEIVTIGETMAAFLPQEKGPLGYIQNYRLRYAGAESNTAIGLSKLGHSVDWISKLGDDALGKYIISQMMAERVSVSHVKLDAEHSTGLMVKEFRQPEETSVYYYRSSSAASFLCPEDICDEPFIGAQILHLTGITPVLSKSCQRMIDYSIELAQKHHLLISFDPNIRLKLWKSHDHSSLLKSIIQKSNIIMLGIDEGNRLYGTNKPEMLLEYLLQSSNIQYIALKNGSEGAYVANRSETHFIPPFPCHSIDSIGAGDAFNAGFLSGILEKRPLLECGQIAGIAGALCTQNIGDIEGLPDRADIDRYLNNTSIIYR